MLTAGDRRRQRRVDSGPGHGVDGGGRGAVPPEGGASSAES